MRKNCSDYPVEVVEGAFLEGNAVLADVLKKISGSEKPRVMLVADQNVVTHTSGLGSRIGRWVQANGIELAGPPILIAGGERVKIDECKTGVEIAKTAIRMKVGMKDIVLVIGGGALLDATGWATGQVRGGVPLVRMPTTPVAMVDSAFAEYAALDGPGVKDAFRVPCRPAGVVIDLSFATTVLDGVWRAGFAAAMRLGVALDAGLVKKLTKLAPMYRERDLFALQELVEATAAVRTKKGDSDFALWAAHRLESMSSYRLPYGYALAIGISIDSMYAVMKGVLPEEERKTICEVLTASGAMDGAVHSQHLMGRDEILLEGLEAWKRGDGAVSITIPTTIGKCTVEEKVDRATMSRVINMLK